MEITRIGTRPSVAGPAEWFDGKVRMDSPFRGMGDSRIGGALVSFDTWFTHYLAHSSTRQTIVVTVGVGWVQREGGPVEEIKPGDIVYFEPSEKHWHGATGAPPMSHIAILGSLDGKNTDWLERVSDEQYRA